MSEEKPRPVSPINGARLPEGKRFEQGEEQRERARRAGKRSGQVRRERKTLRDELLKLLQEKVPGKDGSKRPAQEAMSTALVKQAMSGNIRAFEIIRDTIGEKPIDNVKIISPDFSALNSAFDRLKSAVEGGEE